MGNKKSKTRNIISIVLVALIGLLVWSMVSTQSKWKYSDLGLAEYEKGNYEDAIKNYTTAIESHPEDASLYNNRGLAYFKVKKYKKAISDYSKAIELKPDYAVAYNNRGLAYFKRGGWANKAPFDKAILDFTKAIELKPDYLDAYYNQGLAYNQLFGSYYSKPFSEDLIGRFKKAVADFNKALELDPDYILAYAGLGNVYYRYGEWDKAAEYYNEALKHEDLILKKVGKKGLEGVYYSKARNCNQFQKTYDDALSSYKKVLTLNPDNLDALSHIGMISAIAGDYKGGLEYSNKGIHLIESGGKFGEAAYIYSYRAQCYYGLGEYDKANPDFKKAMKSPSLTGETYRRVGFCYLKMGDDEKAKKAFEKGIAYLTKEIEKGGPYGPGTACRSYNERGLCYTGLGEYDKAISDFEKTRESNPPYLLYGKDFYVEATKNLGTVYREMGDDEKAKSYLEEALKRAEMPEVGMSITAKEIRELLGQMS